MRWIFIDLEFIVEGRIHVKRKIRVQVPDPEYSVCSYFRAIGEGAVAQGGVLRKTNSGAGCKDNGNQKKQANSGSSCHYGYRR